jgi:hypothetical protein
MDARAIVRYGELCDPIHPSTALQGSNAKQEFGGAGTNLAARNVHPDRPDAIAIQIQDLLAILPPRSTLAARNNLLPQTGCGKRANAIRCDACGLGRPRAPRVLETLEPAERLAFVLHDVFGMTVEIDILADPERLSRLDLTAVDD